MDALISSKLPEIKKLLKNYSVISAYLFGSAATDSMTAESDVDFLVTFGNDLDMDNYANNYFDLIYALQNLLNKEVDITTEKTLSNPYLIQKIDSQKIALL